MVVLNDKKVEHLRSLLRWYYETDSENEFERADAVGSIVGVLDYILSTDDQVGPDNEPCQQSCTYTDFIKEQPQDCHSETSWF